MSERGADDIAQARRWFGLLAKDGPVIVPVTADTRRSLERLAKALDGLDPAARGLVENADSMRANVEHCLSSVAMKIRRGRREYDYRYVRGVGFLVLAWQAIHQCSPLTRLKDFQDFAGDVTKDFKLPCPGEDVVRRCLDWS